MMNTIKLFTSLLMLVMLLAVQQSQAQTHQQQPVLGAEVPWGKNELISPAELAARLKNKPGSAPVILNMGVVEDIPGAQHIGPVTDKANAVKLKKLLATVPKSAEVVVYCGCCPFAKCPNIRPAYTALKAQGYTYVKVLDLPDNLQKNWVAKGYPVVKQP